MSVKQDRAAGGRGSKIKIKICGITRKEEVEYLNEAEADYAGFVFYPKSKRFVTAEQAKELCRNLNPGTLKVAVTVSPTMKEINDIRKAGFDILQVHGELTADAADQAGISIWKAVNIESESKLKREMMNISPKSMHTISGFVADGARYGAGVPFPWEEVKETVQNDMGGKTFILAGGLNAENVGAGIRRFYPDVVDVSTGVEENGYKSRERILEFIRKVREHE